MRDSIGRALSQPERPRAQAERRERLHEGDLRGLHQVERAAHGTGDRRESVHLVLARPVLLVDVVEVAARDGRGQTLGQVLEAALRQGDDLVVVRLALNRLREQLDGRAPVDRKDIYQRFEGQALGRTQPAVVARALLEIHPRDVDVRPQRGEHHLDEPGRRRDEILAGLLAHHDHLRRAHAHDLERLPSALTRIDAEPAGEGGEHVDRVRAAGIRPRVHLS